MHRRDFLKSTGGAAAAAATVGVAARAGLDIEPALAAPAVSHAPRTLTLAMPWAGNTSGYADDALRLARRIETACDGAVRIELVDGADDRAGTAMTIAPVNAHVAHHPAFAFFAGLPGETGLEAADLDGWLIAGGGQELWDALASDIGVKPLLAGHSGSDPVLWSRTPIAMIDDFAGRRIFARGLAADVVRGLGGLPVVLDEAAAERGLAAGEIDAAEWGGLVHASAIGLPRAMPFGLAGAFGPASSALSLDIRLDVWERLGGAERTAIAAAASAELRAVLAEDRAARGMIEGAVKARFGAVITRPSSALRAAIDCVAAAIVAHAAGYDADAQRINTSYLTYRRAIGRRDRGVASPLA